jgi:group I intron endonuclease
MGEKNHTTEQKVWNHTFKIADKICLIYKHTTPSGKVYIGQTWQTLKERVSGGRGYIGCVHFWNAIQKYGWENITSEIIYYAYSQEDADEWEDYFIDFYDARNPEKGYNIKTGGSRGGIKHSNETKHKQSISKLGDKNPNYGKVYTDEEKKILSKLLSGENNPFYGKHHSKETIEFLKNRVITIETRNKLSEAFSGEKQWNAKFRNSDIPEIRRLWDSGELSQTEIAHRYGVRPNTINQIVRRKRWVHIK